jgi:hypothetical protein
MHIPLYLKNKDEVTLFNYDTNELMRDDLKLKSYERFIQNEEKKLQDLIPDDEVKITTKL